ncbi:Prefoldin subunit 4 [Mycena indigotica]|uniref:Prefoldin subunit 4 n=1 Tax=Mycena indigotica TaxID=2126181 RepID=A0A8H6TFI7_9AGAR|nr:Prefoldin subunit 4 [Mycena indigotica]KAF7315762.1 Prefoldin subunit 4 [Mycena indigotica]
MNSLRMLDHDEENDEAEEVTWEDQQRINTFSKLNTRLQSMKDKLVELEHEKDALKDLSEEFEMILDEDEPVLYKIGETFIHMPLPRARKRLETDKSEVEAQVDTLTSSVKACEGEMQQLKVILYGKFKSAINLD